MKSVENKRFKLGKEEVTTTFLLAACVRNPTQGVMIDDMRLRIKILDALELADKNKSVIELEDAQIEKAKQLVSIMPWGVIEKGIIEFCDFIGNQ